jgi:signal transduction histidine kinase
VVDRDGLFIARSLDYAERLATPATEYVREAVAAGGEGLYVGVTYEGLRNRTAYTTSALSGWSTHIAVPSIGFTLLDAGSLGFTLLAGAVALVFAAVVAWFGVQDVRMRRLSERAQLQSQKLEAIGQISGGVAHDFNNLLAVMIACLKQLRGSATAPKDIEVIEQGLATAERGAELTRSLLSFARTKPLEVVCVDLRATVAGIRNLLAKSLGTGVTLEVSLSDQARFARTNTTQLELALLNLAVNARDAMPNGGTFTISSRPSRVRGHVDVLVRDTGVGMSESVAARALEPFYTTKPEGKGTGLGLVQVVSLATQSGGALELNTAPGKGAEFVLRLPACLPE